MGYDRLQFGVSAVLLVAVLLPGLAVVVPQDPALQPAALALSAGLAAALALVLIRRADTYRDVVVFFLVGCGVLVVASALVGDGVPSVPATVASAGRTAVVLVGYAAAYWAAFRGGARRMYERLAA